MPSGTCPVGTELYAKARAALAKANRFPMTTRRWWQADAMRRINAVRAGLRQAERRIAAAELALAELAAAQA